MSADKSTTGYDYERGRTGCHEATIGNVAHTFMHDTSGHIAHYDVLGDDPDVHRLPIADDTFIGWNARGLAEKRRRWATA